MDIYGKKLQNSVYNIFVCFSSTILFLFLSVFAVSPFLSSIRFSFLFVLLLFRSQSFAFLLYLCFYIFSFFCSLHSIFFIISSFYLFGYSFSLALSLSNLDKLSLLFSLTHIHSLFLFLCLHTCRIPFIKVLSFFSFLSNFLLLFTHLFSPFSFHSFFFLSLSFT